MALSTWGRTNPNDRPHTSETLVVGDKSPLRSKSLNERYRLTTEVTHKLL